MFGRLLVPLVLNTSCKPSEREGKLDEDPGGGPHPRNAILFTIALTATASERFALAS